MKKIYTSILVATFLFCSSLSYSQGKMFLKVMGSSGLYVGGAQDPKHLNQMEVLAWSWGASTANTMHTGCQSCTSVPNLTDLNVSIYGCLGVIQAKNDLFKGTVIPTLDFYIKSRNGSFYTQKIHLDDVIITGINEGGSEGEDRPVANLSFNYRKLFWEVTAVKPDGTAGATKNVTWEFKDPQ